MCDILLQHLFLCCSSFVRPVVEFVIIAVVNISLSLSELNNAYITEQEYFSTGFELLSFTWQFASRSP